MGRMATAALVAGLRPRDPWAGSEGEEGSTLVEGLLQATVAAWDVRRRGCVAMGIGIPLLVALGGEGGSERREGGWRRWWEKEAGHQGRDAVRARESLGSSARLSLWQREGRSSLALGLAVGGGWALEASAGVGLGRPKWAAAGLRCSWA